MWNGSTGQQPGYVETYFGLRPARIAIVIPGTGARWSYFAHKAMAEANKYWGGAGFVVVPHHGGEVAATLIRAVAAYDPDYVVTLPTTWRELVDYVPDALEGYMSDGAALTREWLGDFIDEPADDPRSEVARARIALACEVHRRRIHQPPAEEDADPEGPEQTDSTSTEARDAQPERLLPLPRWDDPWRHGDESATALDGPHNTPVVALGVQDAMCLAAPANLGGPWGAIAAALTGAVRPPADPSGLETDPAHSEDDLAEVCGWIYRRAAQRPGTPPLMLAYHPHDLTLSVNTATMQSAWNRTTTGLTRVHDGFSGQQATVVVGDTADDFALWLVYDRVWGNAFWVHSAWSVAAPGATGAAARSHTRLLSMSLSQMNHVVVTSASLAAEDLIPTAELLGGGTAQLEPPEPGSASTGRLGVSGRSGRRGSTDVQVPPSFPVQGLSHLALRDDFSSRLTLPSLADDEALVLTTTPPLLAPTEPLLSSFPDLAWQVDIGVEGSLMPRGRGLDGTALAASPQHEHETFVRSGTRSISYENRKMQWVSTVANLEQRVARPRLRFLPLTAWCRVMARQFGYDIAWSDSGRRAKLLEGMWGDRRDLIHDVSGEFFGLTEMFTRTGKSTKDVYPRGEGDYVAGVGGFLHFDSIRDALVPPRHGGDEADGASDGSPTAEGEVRSVPRETRARLDQRTREARAQLDRFLRYGVIRRGLLLGCRVCSQLNFIAVGQVGQHNDCQRCGSSTELTLEAWRDPVAEPRWYYDLHQVARSFVHSNGFAPMWFAQYLAGQARDYTDCAELALVKPGTRKELAEVDLIAHVDGVLITAEVKTDNKLATTRLRRQEAARKRVLWAAVLRADEIVLATTQTTWEPSSVDAMRTALREAVREDSFAPTHLPRLRLVTGLHTSELQDVYAQP